MNDVRGGVRDGHVVGGGMRGVITLSAGGRSGVRCLTLHRACAGEMGINTKKKGMASGCLWGVGNGRVVGREHRVVCLF